MSVDIQKEILRLANQTSWTGMKIGCPRDPTKDDMLRALKVAAASMRSKNYWGAYNLLDSWILFSPLRNGMGAHHHDWVMNSMYLLAKEQKDPMGQDGFVVLDELIKRAGTEKPNPDDVIWLIDQIIKQTERHSS